MSYGGITPENVQEKCPETMFISFTGYNPAPNQESYWKSSKASNVIYIETDDVYEDSTYPDLANPGESIPVKAMTAEQAENLVEFIMRNKDCKRAIIHCHAGISRSGATGVFVNELFNNSENEFYIKHPQVKPNYHILDLLRKAHESKYKPIYASVVVFLTDDEESVLLLERTTPPLGLGLPGGKVDRPWETFEAGAIREVKEELGIDIQAKDLDKRKTFVKGRFEINVYRYLGPAPTLSSITCDPTEHSGAGYYRIDDKVNYAGDTYKFICSCFI